MWCSLRCHLWGVAQKFFQEKEETCFLNESKNRFLWLARVNGLDATEKQLSKGEVDKFLSEFVDSVGADDGTRTRTAVGH